MRGATVIVSISDKSVILRAQKNINKKKHRTKAMQNRTNRCNAPNNNTEWSIITINNKVCTFTYRAWHVLWHFGRAICESFFFSSLLFSVFCSNEIILNDCWQLCNANSVLWRQHHRPYPSAIADIFPLLKIPNEIITWNVTFQK